jgi:methyltransferase (TIGR00027 family)
VRKGRASATAQNIALARAHLTRLGLLDDVLAQRFLRGGRRALHRLQARPPFSAFLRRPFGYLLSRTRFYDDLVTRALDDDVRQVVIVGAGFDTRAWRMAREGVRFIEIDHPDTQTLKRQLVLDGGPEFVPADLTTQDIADALERSSFVFDERACFLCEGLTMYLTEPQNETLFSGLASCCREGSLLGTGFVDAEQHGIPARLERRLSRLVARSGGEPIRFEISPADIPAFLADIGWKTVEILNAPELHDRYLHDTPFRKRLPEEPGPTVVSAVAG